jgi:hypothetical protein
MATKTNWQPNETQKRFMEILKENPNGITLREIKKAYGIEFKTGATNTLKTKGLVETLETKREFIADIVYDGEVIGHKTYADTIYKLVG